MKGGVATPKTPPPGSASEPRLQPDMLCQKIARAARIVVLFILAGAESLPLHVHGKTAF